MCMCFSEDSFDIYARQVYVDTFQKIPATLFKNATSQKLSIIHMLETRITNTQIG